MYVFWNVCTNMTLCILCLCHNFLSLTLNHISAVLVYVLEYCFCHLLFLKMNKKVSQWIIQSVFFIFNFFCFVFANMVKKLHCGFRSWVLPRLKSGIRGSVRRGQESEQIQNTSKFVISVALHSFITEFIGATSHKAKVHAPLSTKTQVVLHLQNHLTSLIIL